MKLLFLIFLFLIPLISFSQQVVISKAELMELADEKLIGLLEKNHDTKKLITCNGILFKVARVTATGSYQDILEESQSKITSEVREIFSSTSNGERVIIENVKCVDAEGNQRWIRPITFLVSD